MSDLPTLRDALAHMSITSPDGVPLEQALAERNGWSLGFAERVADEYCGFLYMLATAGFEVTPSELVDRAWHLHLEWPHYEEVLCRKIVGRRLEHRPGTGEPGEDERFQRQYLATLVRYEEAFGRPPPADIWPCPDPEAEAEEDERQRLQWLSWRVALAAFLAALPAALLGATMIAVLLLAGAFVFLLLGMAETADARRRRKLRLEGDADAGCGGGGEGCASCGGSCGGASCGASCGGGCGGD